LKRPSGTNEPPDPVFFTDRDLGKLFPDILERHGLKVEPYHRHFKAEDVPDEEWLRFVGKRGWVALTHDWHIQYNKEACDALMGSGVKTFFLIGDCPHDELALAFVKCAAKAKRLVRRRGS